MSSDQRVETIIRGVCDARPRMLEEFDSSSCVAATRIGLDIFDAFGISAKPVPVRLTIANSDFHTFSALSEEEQQDYLHTHDITAESVGGAWMVDVNSPLADTDGAGHVVIVLPHASPTLGNVLVDLSADQANRPHKNIIVTSPIVFPLVADAFLTTPDTTDSRTNGDGQTVTYTRVASRRYTQSPNWQRRSAKGIATAFKTIPAETIKEIRTLLNE